MPKKDKRPTRIYPDSRQPATTPIQTPPITTAAVEQESSKPSTNKFVQK